MFHPSKTIKNLAFVLSVVAVTLTLSYAAISAWQEPTDSPPGGNVSAPVNVSSASQTKTGDLFIQNSSNNALLKSNILSIDGPAVINNLNLSADGLLVPNGNVGIGTTTPQTTLDVSGAVKIGSMATCNASVEGALRYDATLRNMQFCNGINWVSIVGNVTDFASDWIAGGPCVGLEVYKEDVGSLKKWKTQNFIPNGMNCNPPQCNQVGGNDGDNLVASNLVDFSTVPEQYPGRDACQVVLGRLPTRAELSCIATNRNFYGVYGSFGYYPYLSSTEKNTTNAYVRYIFPSSSFEMNVSKASDGAVRCVR